MSKEKVMVKFYANRGKETLKDNLKTKPLVKPINVTFADGRKMKFASSNEYKQWRKKVKELKVKALKLKGNK